MVIVLSQITISMMIVIIVITELTVTISMTTADDAWRNCLDSLKALGLSLRGQKPGTGTSQTRNWH